MQVTQGRLINRTTGAPIGISAKMIGNGTQLVLQVNFENKRTVLGTHSLPLIKSFEKAVDKLLKFKGIENGVEEKKILMDSFEAFKKVYELKEIPILARAIYKGEIMVSLIAD